jgi:hypothetical protein
VGQQRTRAGQIFLEGVLGADAFRLTVGNNWARIDPACQFPQVAPTGDALVEPIVEKR